MFVTVLLKKSLAVWDMGGAVLMAVGSGRQLPPGLAGGKTVFSVRGPRPAQTPGHVGVCGQVAFRTLDPEAKAGELSGAVFVTPKPKSQTLLLSYQSRA